jgi:phospholipase/carboxylesterase
MSIPHLIREPAGEPEGALVLLHGRGADEADLHPFLDILDPERRLLGVTPGGPLHLPPGGRHWYAVQRVGYPDPNTFHEVYPQLTGFLDGLLEERGVSWDRTVIGGFSQGAVMSYAVGLGEGRPLPAGIIALSGFIPTVDGWQMRSDGLDGFPVAIGHGSMDPVISIEFAQLAKQRLEAAGADVTYHVSSIGHTIDPRFLATLPAWVAERVPAAAR